MNPFLVVIVLGLLSGLPLWEMIIGSGMIGRNELWYSKKEGILTRKRQFRTKQARRQAAGFI
ncbi:hypothetical protein K431DRAFT_169601 [Polychaeton citri CBS 116435]|uniref:Uncharacterized protein n=1 Tax=Polychaeton citri CBS 116435 TaxID=1314669 RepID=A0A9P4PZR5_9PEZI|nr:hypothetical protein K431DRAFT_169601 [Polychaeton citri CBS 116435]